MSAPLQFDVNKPGRKIGYILKPNGKEDTISLVPGGKYDEVKVKDELFPCFETERDQNNRLMITGKTGCGKSFFANRVAKEMLRRNPKRRLYVVSPFGADPSLDKGLENVIERVDPYNYKIELMKDGIVIVDDIDSLQNEKLTDAIYLMVKALFESGRHYGIDVIYINHTLKNYKKTKYVIQEASHIVVFPNSGNDAQIKNFAKDYIGCDRKAIKDILSTSDSRWLVLYNQYPTYVFGQHRIFFPGKK